MSRGSRDAGGRLVVMPHTDPAVIAAAKAAGMACLPGVATPSEAFAALRAGADALKLFPAETLGPASVKAWRAVLPPGVLLLPVGGITPDNMAPWRRGRRRGLRAGDRTLPTRCDRSRGDGGRPSLRRGLARPRHLTAWATRSTTSLAALSLVTTTMPQGRCPQISA